MGEKLKEILERFDEIERHRKTLRLREKEGVRRSIATWKYRPTSSLVDETSIIGRDGAKEKIMEFLLSNSEHNNNIPVSNKITVLPIVGMGGVGKTTLAQCIYNDPRICQYFDLRRWIYVSEDFDLVRLTKEIYRSITNNRYEEGVGFDHLQDSIKKKLLQVKRTFLVLDDVWNEERCLWQSLQAPFHGAGIVTILMTARNEKVANVMRTTNSFHLGFLSEEEGCQLFRQHALCDDENLLKIGKGIVRKCGGLPLAIKLLGSHLQFERDEDKWMSILESELWEVDPGMSEILPALRLSYQRMPAHLKPCFRYCSMFPKNEVLDKNRLVWLWVAQGYIQTKKVNKTLEEEAIDYFDELFGRSFLQVAENNHNSFKMHDLIFDLAVSISNKEFINITLERGKQNKFIPDNFRHLVIYDKGTHTRAEEGTLLYPFLSKPALRSIFYNCQDRIDIFQYLGPLRLRALHINIKEYGFIMSKFQVLIPSLKHLRYLCLRINFSKFSHVRRPYTSRFFNSFQGMYNLQVLDLSRCRVPLILQESIKNLINLRHLILPENSYMPYGMKKLTRLQTLKHVDVYVENLLSGAVSEIEDLESLTGSCRIYNINFTTDVGGVKKANINKKKHIWRLFLDWEFDAYDRISYDVDIGFYNFDREMKQRSELAEALFESLQPHNNIKELWINNYPGIKFPLWFGNPSYSKLRDITLYGCKKWDGSFEVLQYLQSLVIIDCPKLKNIKMVQPSLLRNLLVANCDELSTLCGLHDLHLLEKLKLQCCSKLQLSLDENFSKIPDKVMVTMLPWTKRVVPEV